MRETGAIATPRVLEVGPHLLALEVLRPVHPDDDHAFWADAGRRVAALHGVVGRAFGWTSDNWLGPTRQYNPRTADGHEFFAANRILRYLNDPLIGEKLDAGDRAAVERICARLPELVPAAPPVLTHGDLWVGNLLATASGEPALIDPAVSWNWAGTDVSMMFCVGAPERFFAAYHEIHPPEPDWRDHLAVLHLREGLCALAQDNLDPGVQGRIRARLLHTLRRFG